MLSIRRCAAFAVDQGFIRYRRLRLTLRNPLSVRYCCHMALRAAVGCHCGTAWLLVDELKQADLWFGRISARRARRRQQDQYYRFAGFRLA